MAKRAIIFCVAIFSFSIVATNVFAKSAQEQRDAIIIEARKHIGTPYKSGGKSPGGFDCSGFIYYIARESLKKQLPRSASAMYKACMPIEESERYAGDLVFFKTTSSGNISHVGLYIGRKQFIHAASDGPNTGIIISSLNESYWKNHYYGFGRFLPSVKGAAQEDKSATSQGESQTAKKQPTEEEVASKKKSNNFNSRDARILCNVSASVDWRGVKVNKFAPNFRGIAAQADITIGHWLFAPGVGAGVRWNYGCGVVQFPIYLTLLVSDYIRVYGGLIFIIGNAHSPGESTLIKAPVFPGMFGLSLFTPSLTGSRKVLVQLMQDFCYTIFKNADGTNLSSQKSYEAGFVLSTGVKISFPLS